ncbi:hypothetical protein D6789_02150 [Candidatus Woesearchaeota archaeon]|nr:MAG: hypothetical protein D6789_02150 [Candidatus Woesearchaeota archaeon]
MNLYVRLGMFFFTIGAILTVLASAFPAQGMLVSIINATLVFTGFFAGILNITSDEEHQFLVSGVVFLVSLLALDTFFGTNFPLVLQRFLRNAALFVGTMTVLVSIRNILEMASQNYHATPLERMRRRTKELETLEHSAARRAWNVVIFFAVALTFILLLMDAFFYDALSPAAQQVVTLLDWVVIILFIIDLVILWREHERVSSFFRECWPDILAAVPVTNSVFALFKVVRITRVARLMRIARVARVHRSAKFFSTKSGFHTYLYADKQEEDIAPTPAPLPEAQDLSAAESSTTPQPAEDALAVRGAKTRVRTTHKAARKKIARKR